LTNNNLLFFLSKKKKDRPRAFWETTNKQTKNETKTEVIVTKRTREKKMRMRHRLRSAEVSHKILIRVTSDKHEKEKNRIIKSSILMKKIIRSEEHLTFSFCRETWLKLTHDTQTKYRDSLIAQWIEKQKIILCVLDLIIWGW
jgi:hypothetical protein